MSILEPKSRLGEILCQQGKLRHDQLEFALKLQQAYRTSGKHLTIGDLLINHRVATLLQVTEALVFQESAHE